MKSKYILSDALALFFAFTLALYLRFGFNFRDINLEWYIYTFFIILFLDVLIIYLKNGYDNNFSSLAGQLGLLVDGLIYSVFVYMLFSYSIKYTYFSRLTMAYFCMLSLLFQLLGRGVLLYFRKKRFRAGLDLKNILIIGDIDDKSSGLLEKLMNKKDYGFRVIGYLSGGSKAKKGPLQCLGGFADYEKAINDNSIKGVFILTRTGNLEEIINYCLDNYISVYTLGNAVDVISYPLEIHFIEEIPVLKVKDIYISGTGARLKRLMDIALSFIALVVLSPLFLVIATAIKLTSPGPVFFKHRRLGLNGRVFEVYKFRTMVTNAEEVLERLLESDPELKAEYNTTYKLKKDPRITKVGGFLRRASLDELPQLINVLKGEMSLVGPRAIVEDEIEKYGQERKHLLRVPPGITGLWQVSGRNDLDYADRVKLDMQYIKNWNIWLDLHIILKTIPAVLKKDGAY
jgi:exopolysaccharide biosynthesis polyprenyl glycosylphosphotransferase